MSEYLPHTLQKPLQQINPINYKLLHKLIRKQVSYRYHNKRKSSINGLFTPFMKLCLLLKLAKFGLILVVLIWLSILFCIDNMCLFHTLFFVSHIFSTIPVPLHFFIIVCSSGGLQVGLLFTE